MLGDNPMMAPPIATGAVDVHHDDGESVGRSSRGRMVMSDRGRGPMLEQP